MISEEYHPLAKNRQGHSRRCGAHCLHRRFDPRVSYSIPRVQRSGPGGALAHAKGAERRCGLRFSCRSHYPGHHLKAFFGKGEPLRGGMPSGHAAVSFSIWTAVFYLTGSVPIVILTFLLAVLVSWSRWSSGIHRPIEVIAGAMLGAGVTFLFFRLFG